MRLQWDSGKLLGAEWPPRAGAGEPHKAPAELSGTPWAIALG